ncbi:MAG: glycosyltransferase family 87 protein [Planctomycetota bacterium]
MIRLLRNDTHWIGWLVLLAALGTVSFVRSYTGRFDFEHFYHDAQYTWEHGELPPPAERQLPFYPPVVSLLLAPLTCAGHTTAAVLWTGGQLVCLAYVLMVLVRWLRARQNMHAIAGPLALSCLIAAPALYEASKFNQLSYLILALLLAALSALERNRRLTAGALIGLATVIKLLPAIFIVWLLVKREWRALAGCVIWMLLIVFLPTLIAFGPRQTAQYHSEWWEHNVRGAPTQGMTDSGLPEHFIDRRNQSLTAICARLLTSDHPYRAPYQPLHVSEQTSTWLARGGLAFLAIGLLWFTRRPAQALDEVGRRTEFAVYLLAMWILSPLSRQYYLVWALPGLVLLLRLMLIEAHNRRGRLGRIGLLVWLAAMVAWIFEIARVYGAHWLALLILGILLLASSHPGQHKNVKSTVKADEALPP